MQLHQVPRIRIVGLLVITFFVSLCAVLVRYTGVISIPVMYLFAPTVVAGVCSQIEWPRAWKPLSFIRGALVIVLCVSLLFPISVVILVGVMAGVVVLWFHVLLTLFFWVPQYFIVVSTYE